jgi:predicted cupin superfamily sugar epimerase
MSMNLKQHKAQKDQLTSKAIKDWFGLTPNPAEGGFFAATYNAPILIPNDTLPNFEPIENQRSICGAIYYFIDRKSFSAMHKVTGDMLYHFYCGDPVEMLLLYPPGHPNKYEVCIFSNDIAQGGKPMKVIPGGTWLGSRMVPGGHYALMGVTMAPGFDPADYKIGNRADLIKDYPEQQELITQLTR